MSHFWHKPLNVVAAGIAVLGLTVVVGAGAAGAARSNAVHHASNVTYSDSQFVDTLNPFQIGAVVDTETSSLQESPMSLWNPKGKYTFLETTTPVISNKGKTYTFQVHAGMKWSNGQAIDANDFVYAWKLGMNPNTGVCTGTCDNIAKIKTFKVHGKLLGLKVTLHARYAPALSNAIGAVGFNDSKWDINGRVTGGQLKSCLKATPPNFTGCDAAANAYEDKTLNYLTSNVVTNGPFKIQSYDSTSGQIHLVQNGNYTSAMPGGKPRIPSATFLPYGSIPAEIAGAANGDTDLTMDYSLANVGDSVHPGTLKFYKNFATLVASNADPEVLTFNTYNKNTDIDSGSGTAATNVANPFFGMTGKGRLVRLALLMSFNRTTMIQNAFAPLDRATAQSLVSYCAPIICTKKSSAPYAARKVIKGDWDPIANKFVPGACGASKNNGGDGSNNQSVKDAKKALKKAGFGRSHKLTVYLSSTTKPYRYYEQAYLQKCWQALGSFVTVNTENIKSSHYFGTYAKNGTLTRGRFEADLHGYGGVPPDPDGWKGNFLGVNCSQQPPQTASQANSDCFHDKVIDKALYAGGRATTPAARAKAYATFQLRDVQQGYWGIMAPLPAIMTWNHNPSGGVQIDPWVNSTTTWNSYAWT